MNDEAVGPQDWRDWMGVRGMIWRISASMMSGVLWFSFIIAWLFFAATDYSIWENLGLVLMSLIALAAINIAIWLTFGMRYAHGEEKASCGSVRGVISGIIVLSIAIFLSAWLFLYADDFSIYQNLAMLLLALVIGGGLNSIVWIKKRCY
jgi:hypothetical protein